MGVDDVNGKETDTGESGDTADPGDDTGVSDSVPQVDTDDTVLISPSTHKRLTLSTFLRTCFFKAFISSGDVPKKMSVSSFVITDAVTSAFNSSRSRFSLARLFWNHVITCALESPRLEAISSLSAGVRYFW